MLAEPGHTSYDLRFRLFGTPVRIHPFFWLLAVLFGWDLFIWAEGSEKLVRIALWIFCCFFSILLHEFGHVWAGAVLGARDSYIVLYSFGGLAVGSNDLWDRWKRICVSLAGPGIQLALYGLIRLSLWLLTPEMAVRIPERAWFLIGIMLYVNLYWPLFNLLPIWPLDGGQIAREICTWISPQRGLRVSLGISVGLAAAVAIHALLPNVRGAFVIPYVPTGTWIAILFGVLAYQSWQLLQQVRTWETPVDDRLPWESDPDAWKRR